MHNTATRGFLVYAYIMQKNRAEPHASHATFEGLFEQINRRSQYALVGISLYAATNASLCPQTEISLCAALTQAHASNCDGDNRDYERP